MTGVQNLDGTVIRYQLEKEEMSVAQGAEAGYPGRAAIEMTTGPQRTDMIVTEGTMGSVVEDTQSAKKKMVSYNNAAEGLPPPHDEVKGGHPLVLDIVIALTTEARMRAIGDGVTIRADTDAALLRQQKLEATQVPGP